MNEFEAIRENVAGISDLKTKKRFEAEHIRLLSKSIALDEAQIALHKDWIVFLEQLQVVKKV